MRLTRRLTGTTLRLTGSRAGSPRPSPPGTVSFLVTETGDYCATEAGETNLPWQISRPTSRLTRAEVLFQLVTRRGGRRGLSRRHPVATGDDFRGWYRGRSGASVSSRWPYSVPAPRPRCARSCTGWARARRRGRAPTRSYLHGSVSCLGRPKHDLDDRSEWSWRCHYQLSLTTVDSLQNKVSQPGVSDRCHFRIWSWPGLTRQPMRWPMRIMASATRASSRAPGSGMRMPHSSERSSPDCRKLAEPT